MVFGLFKKKAKKAVQDVDPEPEVAAVAQPEVDDHHDDDESQASAGEAAERIKNWDDALADISGRFAAVLDEATAASEPLIAATELDTVPLGQAWNAVRTQQLAYMEEVSDAWDTIGDEILECDAISSDESDREGDKRDRMTTEIEVMYETAYRNVMTRAAEVMREFALREDVSGHACQHCGATLDKVKPTSIALNVECGYCEAVNTVDPGQAWRMFAAMGAGQLAEGKALAAWQTMTRAHCEIDLYRNAKDVPMKLLEEYNSSATQYWTTRMTVEAEYVPEQKRHVESKIASYMKHVSKKLNEHSQWRKREG